MSDALAAEPLSAEAIAGHLRTRVLGRPRLECLASTGSTSALALQLAAAGADHGTVVVADAQTAGRGRRGRSWLSPPGRNLYLSVVLRPEALPPSRAPELTLVTAVACAELARGWGCPARIKWPNDLELEGRKLAGILAEMVGKADAIGFVVMGIGLDVNMTEAELPEEIGAIATSLRIARGGAPVPRAALCAALLLELERWLDLHAAQGFAPVKRRWTELSSTLGARVKVSLADADLEGLAVGIDDDGALRLRTASGREERIVAGDVQRLRPQG
jgi:BirA family biotin operon repressor/biotin-[acetyl-CoA-carboxylase] ligase